jgi:hypothetical protein
MLYSIYPLFFFDTDLVYIITKLVTIDITNRHAFKSPVTFVKSGKFTTGNRLPNI